MVTFISIQTLLVAAACLSLAIPFGSVAQICPRSLSLPLEKREQTLQTVPTEHDLTRSNTVTGSEEPLFYPAHYPVTVSSSFVSSTSPTTFYGNALTTVTATVVLLGSTTTEYVTMLYPSTTTKPVEQTLTTTSLSSEPSPRPTVQVPQPVSSHTAWSAPSRMVDLSSFGITYFPSGQHNVKLVSSLPSDFARNPGEQDQSLIQVLYPAHSVNPAQDPVGGANFYASPIDLSSATNVTLKYNVFFPADFDWVRGGKLPGLYGGRTGCSGGTDAEDCFSTRLMWRAGGIGELYLYASKSRQPASLCSSPGSTCNTDYGFSIGRGSFTWTSGSWATVTQTLVLNTEGKANGWFTLCVNDKLAIDRRDIYYRDSNQHPPLGPTKTVSEPSVTKGHTQASATKTNSGGLLGDLLNPLLGHGTGSERLLDGEIARDGSPYWVDRLQRLFSVNIVSRKIARKRPKESLVDVDIQVPLISASAGISEDGSVHLGLGGDQSNGDEDKDRHTGDVGFLGIFFSTFFGGHEDKYATPKDQYIWFRDFSLTINA
ncbi:hypothetical protein D9756_007966 [Leucocoprinus leucothites]|uniref:Polysaccharide lyase 14 domain-containing protein n=1 Tax=Leucocoprinus leucothites TaxID=201217 RepID=A0A8H5D4E7_9AGAR|nr:hypothetical protein D9756_007966 [Leucoagaricus leucothites]